MCKDVTMLIGGILTGICKFQHIPEVPRFSHMNHLDMLLINRSARCMLAVEYKLKNIKSLKYQCNGNAIKTIGIINKAIPLPEKVDNGVIYGFTGTDRELELIGGCLRYRWSWTKLRGNCRAYVYWFGYMNSLSSINGGFQYGKRTTFFQLYKIAIKNLQIKYKWTLDFDIVYEILGSYSPLVAKKYFNQVKPGISDKELKVY